MALLAWFLGVGSALAQAQPQAPAPPPAEPPVWAGSLGAGLALTSGNADTTNLNLGIKLTYDPRSPHVVTGDAFYLHGTSEGDTIVSRTSLNVRDDYTWTDRTTFFGQFRYLRDTFKGIDPLTAALGGVAYKLVNLEPTKFTIDAGGGVVWERNPGLGTSTSGALTLGETFSHRFSSAATFTHSANGLWKTADFGDSLYTLAAGLAATITPRTQLKVELLELYKSQPPPGIEKGDLSLVTSVVYSF
jgi:putative salt-induced outer membrane protein YdiY